MTDVNEKAIFDKNYAYNKMRKEMQSSFQQELIINKSVEKCDHSNE